MKGSCLCGGVEFKIERFIEHITHCHCSMCRKFSGAAFATYAVAFKRELRILGGESLIKYFHAPNGTKRSFCSSCGSSLFFESLSQPDKIDIALGVMDEVQNVKVDAHIYVASQADWYHINDELPQFEEGHDLYSGT